MVSKGFPNVTTSGQQYNIGEKPSVILYTYINHHAGTPNHNQEVLYLQPLIPPKRFDFFFTLTGGCSEGLGAF